MRCTVRLVWYSDGLGYTASCQGTDDDGLVMLHVKDQPASTELVKAAKAMWIISFGEQLTLPFD
jgi:hypothetical protein